MKKPSKKTLRKKLDKAWRDVIMLDGKCAVCGSTSNLNAHHIVGRRNLTLRWDPKNGILLCPLHHVFGTQSAHQDPLWFHEFLLKNHNDKLKYLDHTRNVITRWTIPDMLDCLEYLTDVLRCGIKKEN